MACRGRIGWRRDAGGGSDKGLATKWSGSWLLGESHRSLAQSLARPMTGLDRAPGRQELSRNAQSATIVNPPWCCDNAKHGAKPYAALRQRDYRQWLGGPCARDSLLHNERGLDCAPIRWSATIDFRLS